MPACLILFIGDLSTFAHMTPDRRLDQLEPLMADSLQKIDRLIEGQGKLVDLAVNTRGELDEVKITLDEVKTIGENTAQAVADLTVNTQKSLAGVDDKVDDLRAEMNQRFDQLITLIQDRLS